MNGRTARNASPQLLEEVCRARQIEIRPLSGGRVLVLSRNGVACHIYGWDFGINSSTALLVCRNKAVCSALLSDCRIPCIPHEVFYRPDRESFGFPYDASWSKMIEFLEAHPEGVVCKPNDLSRGVSVHRVASVTELEKAAYEVFRFSREVTLSPFVAIDAEYRVVMLNGHCRLMYVKRLPTVTGDGTSTLGELIAVAHRTGCSDLPLSRILNDMEQNGEMSTIPARDKVVRIGWRYNLAHGARAELLDSTAAEMSSIVHLAERAASALGVAFAAVDVAENGGEYSVLEVNTGIVTTRLLQQIPSARPAIRDLYGAVVDQLFECRKAVGRNHARTAGK